MSEISVKELIQRLQEYPEDAVVSLRTSYAVEHVEHGEIIEDEYHYDKRTPWTFDSALRGEKHIPAWQAVRRETITITAPWETYGDGNGLPLVEAPLFSNHYVEEPPQEETVMVHVNGEAYPTNIYSAVQYFVGDAEVTQLSELMTKNFGLNGQKHTPFYQDIPDSLKALDHANGAVNHAVKMNESGYFGLNELAVAVHRGEVTLEDYMEFQILIGYSVAGFLEVAESMLSNLDRSPSLVKIENPLWETADEAN